MLPDIFRVAKHRKVGPPGPLFIRPAGARNTVEMRCLGHMCPSFAFLISPSFILAGRMLLKSALRSPVVSMAVFRDREAPSLLSAALFDARSLS